VCHSSIIRYNFGCSPVPTRLARLSRRSIE
jgi:hypothetical protein